MASTGHSIACPHCGGKFFREDKIVELDASVMITKGMRIPAQTRMVSYQYTCVSCEQVLDEHFEKGNLSVR